MPMPLTDNNPLYNSQYLLGPIETIVCSRQALVSGHLSLHDIAEAYRVLSMRIRDSSRHLSVASDPFLALESLKDRCADVVAALRRDISRDQHISAWHTSNDSFVPTTETVGWELTTYNTNRATDFSILCHYALRLLSEIFRLPALSSLFTSQDLGLLLEDVISIVRSLQPPSFNVSKAAMLSSWVVRTQRLPKDVLLSRMEDIILYLKLILEAAIRDTYVIVTTVDALNCIVNLLTFHQNVFVARLAVLLPSIFPIIMHRSPDLRHHAAVVLATFSQTLITYRSPVGDNTIETIRFHTQSFLTPETTRHPTSCRKLPPLLDAAVSSKNFGNIGENSPWALTIVASFAILLGPSLFLHQGPLKLVMNIAQKALRHRPGRGLNPHVWRTFIWSMTELYIQRISVEDGDMEIVQRCVLILKQALHGGLGAALITSLMDATPSNFQNKSISGWAIRNVTDIIHDMLSSKYQDIRDEACRILGCLTRRIEPISDTQRETYRPADGFLSQFLFDGSLLRADCVQIDEMVRSTSIVSPRCLSPEEISTHWHQISSCVVLAIRNSFKDGETDLATTAITIWQSLLLAQAQETSQPTASADFGLQLSSLLSQFLPEPSVSLPGETKAIKVQIQSLVILKHLWIVVENTFSQPWLAPVASSFLVSILQRNFYLANQEVLTNWSLLCSSLIAVGIPNVLDTISHQDESHRTLEIKRQLWRLVATPSDSSTPNNWQHLISVLKFPLGSWSMSEDDLDIWERVLERDFSVVDPSTNIVDIIDNITDKCPAIGPRFSINTALGAALAVLRRLNLSEGDYIPARALSYLNMTLTASYPPQPSTINRAFELIKAFHHMTTFIPTSLLEPFVLAVQTGLAIWIEDKCLSLSDDQYNDLLMSLYDSLLTRLQSLPLSVTSLNSLVPLLIAAFSRIPPPALGPAAFLRFFNTVHARLAALPNAYSDELRVCIDACVRGYGRDWPSGMVPLSSSSQTQTQLGQLTIEVLLSPAVRKGNREQILYSRSIEHEVIPDSQCAISHAGLDAPLVGLAPGPQQSSRECHKLHESTRSYGNPALRKHHLPPDTPSPKRHRATAPTKDGLRTRSVPLADLSSPILSGPRSLSAPRSLPRRRLVMECVEVVPLRELLHRRTAEAGGKRRQQQTSTLDHGLEFTPERPIVPKVTREQEKDEIVPETPDAVLRPGRISLPAGIESSPGSGSPTRLLVKAQHALDRTPLTSTRLAAALREVHDVFSRPGISQIPAEELTASAQLLDAANRQLRMSLVAKTNKVTVNPA